MRKLIMLVPVICLTLAACGGSSATAPSGGSAAGVYHLQTVNGQSLPFVVQQTAAGKVEVTDDQYSLNGDGTYSEQGHYRVTTATAVTTQAVADVGAYSLTNGAITLRSTTGNGTTSGSVGGGTMTLVEGGLTAVYKK